MLLCVNAPTLLTKQDLGLAGTSFMNIIYQVTSVWRPANSEMRVGVLDAGARDTHRGGHLLALPLISNLPISSHVRSIPPIGCQVCKIPPILTVFNDGSQSKRSEDMGETKSLNKIGKKLGQPVANKKITLRMSNIVRNSYCFGFASPPTQIADSLKTDELRLLIH
ncbi:unnamed protein product [Phytophthora lilii]|uniref:Unnamed protein product n=1 Tax=Phytophthora lilii TaxID=2077276 RepID=A0A9W6XBR2_9STRA|nr:unnamed protein product [Phytophthora lilii]